MGNHPNSVSRIVRLKPFIDKGFIDLLKYMKTLSPMLLMTYAKEMTP
jgi:hypothetical protein